MICDDFLIYPLNAKRQNLFSKFLTSQVIIFGENCYFVKRKNVFIDITVVKCGLLNIGFPSSVSVIQLYLRL